MFKTTTQVTVKTELVKVDRTANSVWRHAKNPQLCTDAISRFKHYTCPVAYKKGKYYYVLTHFSSIESMKKLQQTSITLEEIQLTGTDILEFLLSFQYHQHKEILCMVELFKIAIGHTSKGKAGEKWLKSIVPGTKDIEKQFSELFSISKHACKCYFKLVNPIHKDTLAKFKTDSEFTLSQAYKECREREYNLSPTKGGQVLPGQTQALTSPTPTNASTSVQPSTGGSASTSTVIQNSAPPIVPVSAPTQTNSPATSQSNTNQQPSTSASTYTPIPPVPHPLTSEVVVKFNSGQTLSLSGIVDIAIDHNPLTSLTQLAGNGNELQLPYSNTQFFLTIYNP